MKNKVLIIVGIILTVLGIGLCIFAATLDGFNLTASYEYKEVEYGEVISIKYEGMKDNLIIEANDNENTYIEYYENNNYYYDITYNELTKELLITQKGSSFFNLRNSINDFKIKVSNLINEIDINTDAGNTIINDLYIHKLKVNLDAGNVKLTNTVINISMIIDVNAGNLITNNVESMIVNVDIDAGNIDYDGKINMEFNCNIDVGKCKLCLYQNSEDFMINKIGAGHIKITYDIDLGDFDIYFK